MSIQPSLSKSRKAQPAPVDSGRYFSGEAPLECTNFIPVAVISLKGLGLRDSSDTPRSGSGEARAQPARERRKCRRRKRSERFIEAYALEPAAVQWVRRTAAHSLPRLLPFEPFGDTALDLFEPLSGVP